MQRIQYSADFESTGGWLEPDVYEKSTLEPFTPDQNDAMSMAVGEADYTSSGTLPPKIKPNVWEVIAGLGNTDANVIKATNGTTATPPIVYDNSKKQLNDTIPTTTDKRKKTTAIALIVVGVVAVIGLLFFALKKNK